MAAIALQGLSKRFGKTEVIHGVDLQIDDGEFVVFVGPSGCGKSTLLRLIAGLEDISAGRLLFDNEDVSEHAPSERGIAMVFQSYALYPHMSVHDNMAFGLKQSRTNKTEIEQRVREAARVLQIETLLDRKPRELSGGQRQRVAIGRAIVRQPRVFLFDEPLSNLDAALRVQMRIEIARLHRELKTTMIYVTHDQIEAMTLADRIVVLNNGRVEQVGSPLELYHQPRNLFVAGFIGSPRMNFLRASVRELDASSAKIAIDGQTELELSLREPGRLRAGADVTIGVRPEHLQPCARGDGVLSGDVFAVENMGSEVYVHFGPERSAPVVCRTDGSIPMQIGETIDVRLDVDQLHLFDSEGRTLSPISAP